MDRQIDRQIGRQIDRYKNVNEYNVILIDENMGCCELQRE